MALEHHPLPVGQRYRHRRQLSRRTGNRRDSKVRRHPGQARFRWDGALRRSAGAWGLFVDATYLSLSDDTTQGPISVDGELDTGLYEFAVTYTPGGESGASRRYAGARIVDLSLKIKFSAAVLPQQIRRANDKSYIDFMVGGRYIHLFNDRWLFNVRADIGGGRHGVELERARRVWLEIRRRSRQCGAVRLAPHGGRDRRGRPGNGHNLRRPHRRCDVQVLGIDRAAEEILASGGTRWNGASTALANARRHGAGIRRLHGT